MSGAWQYYDQYEQYYGADAYASPYAARNPQNVGRHASAYQQPYQMMPQAYGAYPIDPRCGNPSKQCLAARTAWGLAFSSLGAPQYFDV